MKHVFVKLEIDENNDPLESEVEKLGNLYSTLIPIECSINAGTCYFSMLAEDDLVVDYMVSNLYQFNLLDSVNKEYLLTASEEVDENGDPTGVLLDRYLCHTFAGVYTFDFRYINTLGEYVNTP